MKPQVGQKVEVVVERLGLQGEGVARFQGFTLFVDGALPEEQIEARIYEVRKNFGRARVLRTIHSSLKRETPPCPLFGKCGGCQLMHLSYEAQLEYKRQKVVDAMERIGKCKNVLIRPCAPAPFPLGYRNKIQLPIGPDLLFGLYAYNTHDLIPVKECLIHHPLGEKVFQAVQRSTLGREQLKHVLIKTAVFTKEALVILVSANPPSAELQGLAAYIMETVSEVKGVVHNLNVETGNTVLGKEYQVLAGRGYVEETLLGLRFNVSPASFFQVNPFQAEKLYTQVVTYAALTGKEVVLDAYCGVGTLALLLAGQAHKVIGIECVPEAVFDAKVNAEKNGIRNVEFLCGDVYRNNLKNREFGKEAPQNFDAEQATIAEGQGASEHQNSEAKPTEPKPDSSGCFGIDALHHIEIDVAVVNPPRKGCEAKFLNKLAELGVKRLVYVSCDPATLARDTALLAVLGYNCQEATPFDMFPQTSHVETVALFTRLPSF